MSNIVLDNIQLSGGLTLPGVLLCNATVPCTNFTFTDVNNTGSFLVSKQYVCDNVQAVFDGSTPVPECSAGSEALGVDGVDAAAEAVATRVALWETAIAELHENQGLSREQRTARVDAMVAGFERAV